MGLKVKVSELATFPEAPDFLQYMDGEGLPRVMLHVTESESYSRTVRSVKGAITDSSTIRKNAFVLHLQAPLSYILQFM